MKQYSLAILAIFCCTTESITTELLFVIYNIPTLAFGLMAVPVSGILLLMIYRFKISKKITIFKEWKLLLIMCLVFTINEITWFDAVGRIGASKTTLIDNPLGAILIVIMAYIFLRERLNKLQLTGVITVIAGVTISLSLLTTKTQTVFGIGELEAIITAIAVAVYTIMAVGLLKRHGAYQVTAFTLLIGGIMFQSVWFIYPQSQLPSQINPVTWLYLIPALTLPLIVFLPQDMSIIRIGPSLTEVIVITNIILTTLIQALLFYNHIPVALPENLILAFVGGIISIGGMVCIFLSDRKNEVVQIK